eukprot:g12196.t1
MKTWRPGVVLFCRKGSMEVDMAIWLASAAWAAQRESTPTSTHSQALSPVALERLLALAVHSCQQKHARHCFVVSVTLMHLASGTDAQAVKQIGNTLRKSVELLLSHLQSEDCIERPL